MRNGPPALSGSKSIFDRRRRGLVAERGEDLRAHGDAGIEVAAVEADDPPADQPFGLRKGAIRPAVDAADELGGRMARAAQCRAR